MILDYEQPVFNKKTNTWEIKIKVQGQNEIYTQIVNFQTIKSAQEYIGFIDLAIKQRRTR